MCQEEYLPFYAVSYLPAANGLDASSFSFDALKTPKTTQIQSGSFQLHTIVVQGI